VTAAVLASATWLGGMGAAHLPFALGAVVVVMFAGGLWRHLSAEYGPSLATASAVLFLIGLAQVGGDGTASRHFLAALTGGLWGVVVQVAWWPFRAQHPLRRAVADSWLALSDLLVAITPDEEVEPAERHRRLDERQALVRTALDQATATLAAAAAGRSRPYLRQLDQLNVAAARFATRFLAFNTSLETLMVQPSFAALGPGFAVVLKSLTNTTRLVALTVVSRQPTHLAAAEARLRRLHRLLQSLESRVLVQTSQAPDGTQLTFLLQQIDALLPAIQRALRDTIDRADEHAAFSLELLDLQTWTLRPLASTLNLQWRPDGALLRFIARSTVLQLIGVAVFKHFGLERGYWLPLTMLVVLQPDYGATRLRAGQRVVGTLAGSLAASLLLWLSLPPGVLLGAMGVTMFGFAFWLKRNYAIAVCFITLFVVLITEVSTRITIAFTIERLLATAAGGLLALGAAHIFWPVWERQRLPALLAGALRANRDLLQGLGARLATGGGYDAQATRGKRAAEIANSLVFASLERLSLDPPSQQTGTEQAAALANANQRLTRAFTVVALQLTPGRPLERSDLTQFVTAAGSTLDLVAGAVESGRPDRRRIDEAHAILDQLPLSEPTIAPATPLEHSAYSQFARCATELSAMLLAVRPAEEPAEAGPIP
jgi:uncharacterized membrane protein YccC